jgi:hypothetical protein
MNQLLKPVTNENNDSDMIMDVANSIPIFLPPAYSPALI